MKGRRRLAQKCIIGFWDVRGECRPDCPIGGATINRTEVGVVVRVLLDKTLDIATCQGTAKRGAKECKN